ncbi:hypothetical protein FRC12_017499, partial [Ceratobasidium sp. 428]
MHDRVPVEILELILAEGAKMDWHHRLTMPTASNPRSEFRDVVTWVCRFWRLVTLNLPSTNLFIHKAKIWARINLSDGYTFSRSLRYMDRIGRVEPLHIQVNTKEMLFGYDERSMPPGIVPRLVEALKTIERKGGSTSRWKSLHIQVHDHHGAELLGQFLSEARFYTLESFSIIGPGPFYPGWVPPLERALDTIEPTIWGSKASSPQLRSVTLKYFSLRYLLGGVGTLMLSNLTRLELLLLDTYPPPGDLCLILESSIRLQVFRLALGNGRWLGEQSDLEPGQERVTLPSLEELSLDKIHSALWAHQFFSVVEAPKLNRLGVTTHESCTDGMSGVVSLI